ncbi:MAG TPA: hypothetical protein VFZ87_13165 [Gemmatimonadales bacterium]
MPNAGAGVRVAGAWLAIAAILLGGVLAFHGPLVADLDAQMGIIASSAKRWAVVHWVAAVTLSLFAVAGLVVLAAGSRLTRDWWTMSAWAVLPIGALWTVPTAVAEATAIADAAAAGNRATFEAWWAFAAGMGTGFSFLALAVAAIAGHEARTPRRVMPAWASWIGSVAGGASFLGWALGMWLGIDSGNVLWVASSLVMCLWLFWFGVALTRTAAAE